MTSHASLGAAIGPTTSPRRRQIRRPARTSSVRGTDNSEQPGGNGGCSEPNPTSSGAAYGARAYRVRRLRRPRGEVSAGVARKRVVTGRAELPGTTVGGRTTALRRTGDVAGLVSRRANGSAHANRRRQDPSEHPASVSGPTPPGS